MARSLRPPLELQRGTQTIQISPLGRQESPRPHACAFPKEETEQRMCAAWRSIHGNYYGSI
jgi:hypothetical protein